MKTEHVELEKAKTGDNWFVRTINGSRCKPTKEEDIDYIKNYLKNLAEIQAEKYTDLIKEFDIWEQGSA